MNAKQIRILGIILVLLVVGVVLKKRQVPSELHTEEAESLEFEIDTSALSSLIVRKGESEVQLEKINEQWLVRSLWDARADSKKIEEALSVIPEIKGEVRASSEELFSDFGITDEEALHVILSEATEIRLHLLIGLESAGWQNHFIRKEGSSTVYVANTPLLYRVGIYGDLKEESPKPETWLDLAVFTFDTTQVTAVQVKENASSDWSDLGQPLPYPQGEAELKGYLNGVAGLRANEVVDPEGTAYGLGSPDWQVQFVRENAEPIILSVGALKEGSALRYAQLSDAPQVYLFSEYTLKQVLADGSRLIKEDPLGLAEAPLTRLSVHTPEKEVVVAPKEDTRNEVKDYVNALKTFKPDQVNNLPEQDKKPNLDQYWIEFEQETGSLSKLMCQSPPEEESEKVLCVNPENEIPFLVTQAVFNKLFSAENIEKLQPPEESVEKGSAVQTETEEGAES